MKYSEHNVLLTRNVFRMVEFGTAQWGTLSSRVKNSRKEAGISS
jgi:hypothetical protein